MYLRPAGILGFLLAFSLNSCAADRIARRVPSPDRKLEALIVYVSFGAPTELEFEVYIVPSGMTDFRNNNAAIFSGSALEDLALSWANNEVLDIHYSKGVVEHFRNYWVNPVKGGGAAVEIRLKPSGDFTLDRSEV